METFLALTARHGYSIIFLAVFAESVGLPVPAALAMVAGGAAAASGILSAPWVFVICVAALMTGDLMVYYLGRKMGWWLLAFLCKVSMNPETCILRSAESFYKRGRATLVFAKFVPGLATMAAPLAGSMKMRLGQFAAYDLAGSALYTLVYAGIGYLFHNFLSAIMRGFEAAGRLVEAVVVIALLIYVVYRIRVYIKHRIYREVPRVPAELIAQRFHAEAPTQFLLADVRSHGYYDAGALRIQGSIRIEPNNLKEIYTNLPRDREIYLYCT
jgi:membrane protein DedA with SNARE-associated domain